VGRRGPATAPRDAPRLGRRATVRADECRRRLEDFGTDDPNRWIAVRHGHFLRLATRHESANDFVLDSVAARLDQIDALPLPPGHLVRPRGAWHDDAHGTFVWYLDYLVPHGEEHLSEADDLGQRLGQDRAWEDGQFYDFDIAEVPYSPMSEGSTSTITATTGDSPGTCDRDRGRGPLTRPEPSAAPPR
jgi:hypothetical protein